MYIEKDKLEEIVKISSNRKECFEKLNIHPSNTSSYRILKYWVDFYKIDTSHFISYNKMVLGESGRKRAVNLQEILEGKHPFHSRNGLKTKLIKQKIFEECCSICMLTEWRGKKFL